MRLPAPWRVRVRNTIELLSVREQQRRGIQAQSLEEKARLLFAREQEYHRRLRNIDI